MSSRVLHNGSGPGEEEILENPHNRDEKPRIKRNLILDILIRGNGNVGPMQDVRLIARTAGVTVKKVKERLAALGLTEPISIDTPVTSSPGAIITPTDSTGDATLTVARRTSSKNRDVPPLTFLDTLSPGEKDVVCAFHGYDGHVFDGVPRKDLNTIAADRGTGHQGAYVLLKSGLRKLQSTERPVQKKRGRPAKTGGLVRKSIARQSTDIRPTHTGIPEDCTQTYGDLLVWLRIPDNASLVDAFEETARLTKLKYSTYPPGKLEAKISEKFKEGYMGHAVLALARYLEPAVLLQDFIREIRKPTELRTAPSRPIPETKPQPQRAPTSTVPHHESRPPLRRHVFVVPHGESQGRPQPSSTKPLQPDHRDAPIERAFPEFSAFTDAIQWLRAQDQWHPIYQEALQLSSERELTLFLTKQAMLLLRVLLSIKTQFSRTSILDILPDVFPKETGSVIASPAVPPETPADSSSDVSVPPGESDATPPSSGDTSAGLHITSEHETTIREIFQLHQEKKYREFWEKCQALADTDIMQEIVEVQEQFQLQNWIQAMAYISGYDMKPAEIHLYVKYHWSQRMKHLPYVKAQIDKLLAHDDKAKERVIRDHLSVVDITVPENVRQKWHGFDELDAPKRTLFEIVIALVKSRKSYQKKDEESTKKLLRVAKQIIGQEAITAEDEDIKERA